ncbi:MAG: hypothetical protein VX764_02250 [Planctomycetota bacterium]|nr:hypothetical protein [Planctomycetota bacterium]
MAISDRPGGLTALAVLNGFFALVSGATALQRLIDGPRITAYHAGELEGRRWLRRRIEEMVDSGIDPIDLQILGVVGLVAAVTLAISIWGLLTRRKLAGRWCSTVAAISLVTVSILAINWLPTTILRGTGISIVRQLFYPLFMLFMVQIIFRKDLAR